MDFDLAIALLKACGALMAGVLGSAAIFTNFRDADSGRLRWWGKAILGGIVISSLVGVLASAFEAWKAKTDSQEQLSRANALLSEINRSIQPISALKITAFIEIPFNNDRISPYVERLKSGINTRMNLILQRPVHPVPKEIEGISASVFDIDSKVRQISIKPSSDLWPHGSNESLIGAFAQASPFSIVFLRNPVDPVSYNNISGSGDFEAMGLFSDYADLSWDLKRNRLVLHSSTDFPKNFWKTSGNFMSVIDLKGSQLLLFPPNSIDYKIPDNLLPVGISRDDFKITDIMIPRTIFIDFGSGRRITVKGSQLKKTAYSGGSPVFSVIFPKDDLQFNEFIQGSDEE